MAARCQRASSRGVPRRRSTSPFWGRPPARPETPLADPDFFRPGDFQRTDETDDALFYEAPRFVTHIDDQAIAALTDLYRELLPADGVILDLMSSWVSHLPDDVAYGAVHGLGMNPDELVANPRLTGRIVHDINIAPVLPYVDEMFDAALIAVSVQYLTRPIEVFAEIGRVLRPRAPLIITYSNRCFPTKAVAIWQALGDRAHADLIGAYFSTSGMFGPVHAIDLRPDRAHGEDPLYAVIAHRLEEPAPQDEA